MNKLRSYIDLQIRSNQGKNLFHKHSGETMKFIPEIFNVIHTLNKITPDSLTSLIDYTTEKTLQEICRVNQYFSFQEDDKIGLKNIYRNLHTDITEKTKPVETISEIHYQKLKSWLEKTNPFASGIYSSKKLQLNAVACSEYSGEWQEHVLCLNKIELTGPLLDIGCGTSGNLVKRLREKGIQAFGFDRFAEDLPYLEKSDWLEFDYGIEKWGTVVSNLGFSNHFVHNHLRKDGNFTAYAQKYMDILKSLKTGGCFCYAPGLPFIEQYLDKKCFKVVTYSIENSMFKTTIVKRIR